MISRQLDIFEDDDVEEESDWSQHDDFRVSTIIVSTTIVHFVESELSVADCKVGGLYYMTAVLSLRCCSLYALCLRVLSANIMMTHLYIFSLGEFYRFQFPILIQQLFSNLIISWMYLAE